MPRVSREAKAESHERIVEVAARQFREQGIEATGVADVMKAAGLTHGGFYRHFGSKEELAAAAIERAFGDMLGRLDAVAQSMDGRSALVAFITMFLSGEHIANPGRGCPIVALGIEAARGSKAERLAMAAGIETAIGRLAALMGGDASEASTRSAGLMSLLVGTVTLARSASSEDAREAILLSGRRLAVELLPS